MNHFNRPSRLVRSLSAAAALMTTVLVMSSVIGLALHYEQGAPAQSTAAVPTAAVAV